MPLLTIHQNINCSTFPDMRPIITPCWSNNYFWRVTIPHFHSPSAQSSSLKIAVKGAWRATEARGGRRGERGGEVSLPATPLQRRWRVMEKQGKNWLYRVLAVRCHKTPKDSLLILTFPCEKETYSKLLLQQFNRFTFHVGNTTSAMSSNN